MFRQIRYAFRTLRQNPGFALSAIVSIALAIGANSAIFSMADGLLWRPPSFAEPSRVVSIRARTPGGTFSSVSYPDFEDFRSKSRTFAGLLAYSLIPAGFAKERETQPQIKTGYLVSSNFFQVLGIEPQLGRRFRVEEDAVPGRDAVAVLSHDLWQSEFGADPAAIGQRIRLNDLDFTVIAVLPESFTGIDHLFRPAFYVPAAMGPRFSVSNADMLTNRSRREFFVKGRLADGVSITAAEAEIASIAKSLEESNPITNQRFGAAVRTERQLRMELDPGEAEIITFLFALVAVVLTIACANVANLMLNRGRSRVREIAVRFAIGARRSTIISQLLTESLLIALAGGALGLLLTEYAVGVFSQLEVPSDLPIQFTFKLDYRVVAFTFAASVVSAVLFGLAPALQLVRTELVTALKTGESDKAKPRLPGRRALVMVQIAGSVVLVVAAAQIYRGFEVALSSNHGFQTERRITLRFAPAEAGYTFHQTRQFYTTLLERARNVPGVKSAALSARIPMTSGGGMQFVTPEGYEFPPDQDSVRVMTDYVSDKYFETFGIPIIAGRGFRETDRAGSPGVAIVNEQFARNYFNGNPVGKRLRTRPDGPWVEVVGMTVTGRYFSVFESPVQMMYLPFSQQPQRRMTLIAETLGDPAAMTEPLRKIALSIGPNVPILSVRTMRDLFDQRSVKVANVFRILVGLLGGMGLVLALVGLYAVVSYQAGRRTREIGIRMALGAARPKVLAMILKQAATMTIGGVLLGSILSAAGNRLFVRGTLGPEVVLLSPMLFAAIVTVLLATVLLAAAIPARHASQIDPQRALRQE